MGSKQATGNGQRATETARPQAPAPETAPADPADTTAPAEVPALVSVSLSETSGLDWWRDPQTGLEVTRESQVVPIEMIGEACRREPAVVIDEV